MLVALDVYRLAHLSFIMFSRQFKQLIIVKCTRVGGGGTNGENDKNCQSPNQIHHKTLIVDIMIYHISQLGQRGVTNEQAQSW